MAKMEKEDVGVATKKHKPQLLKAGGMAKKPKKDGKNSKKSPKFI